MLNLPDLDTLEEEKVICGRDDKRIAWLNQRRGRFTASAFFKLMSVLNKPNELPKGSLTYIRQIVSESLTNAIEEEVSYQSPAMVRGGIVEHAAVDAFVAKTCLVVTDCKDEQRFIKFGEHIGCTADGLINNGETGIEIKSPNSDTHVFNLYNIECGGDLLKHYPEYYWQVQGLMLITGADYWYWVSFDPRFIDEQLQLHIVKIDRVDSDIELLSKRLSMAIDMKKSIIRKIFAGQAGE